MEAAVKRACMLAALALLVLVAHADTAQGYSSIRVNSSTNPGAVGLNVRWDLANGAGRPNVANRRVRYVIEDTGTQDTLTGPVNEFAAIQNATLAWRRVASSEIDFEFAGAEAGATTSGTDNKNVIRFVGSGLQANVFAVTITTFDTATGQITDADLELNDRDFTWDTTGPSGTTGTPGRASIENVVTHELGHFIGLDHTANAQSTLYDTASAGMISQMSLETDDVAQIARDYPNADFANPALGSVSGSVTSGGNAQFGVTVSLVDVATGRVVIGAISERATPTTTLGAFKIDGVPPGNYMVLATVTDAAVLGAYYASSFVSFFPVVRGVAVNTIGSPLITAVAPGQAVTGVTIDLPASTNPLEPDNSSAQARTMTSGQVAVSAISPPSDEDWFKFTVTATQAVTVRVIADRWGSNLNPTLTIYDTSGAVEIVSPSTASPFHQPSASDIDGDAFDASGVDFDAQATTTINTPGTYFFKVASRAGVSSGQYVVTLEFDGAVVTPNAVASTVTASVAGVPADGATQYQVTVNAANVFGRSLNGQSFTVELIDRTGGGSTVLATQGPALGPWNFTRTAQAAPGPIVLGARINGVDLARTVTVSQHGSLSVANSRVRSTETSLVANGVDRSTLIIELRDGANNLRADSAATVSVTTSLGTLDNGTTTGATVAAVFDSASGTWRLDLVAGTGTGTASVTASANSQALAPANVPITALATGTGGGGGGGGGNDDEGGDDDDGGGCAVVTSGALSGLGWLVFAALSCARARRQARGPRT
jgi:hypothetical protein